MTATARRGHGEGSVYRDAANGTWVGAISLGWRPDGSRIRRKVTGRTKTEVREKLKRLQAEADAGLKTSASYTVAKAVDDWAAEALDGLAGKTVRSHVDLLRPVTMLIGHVPLRDLTAQDVRRALSKLAQTRSTRTMASTHNVLVRAIRHAEANDRVGRNVASLVKPPQGKTGRPSRAMTAAEATEQAIMAYGAPGGSAEHEGPDREVSLDYLCAKARSAYRSYQATRYDRAGRILPGLICGVETAARSEGTAKRRDRHHPVHLACSARQARRAGHYESRRHVGM